MPVRFPPLRRQLRCLPTTLNPNRLLPIPRLKKCKPQVCCGNAKKKFEALLSRRRLPSTTRPNRSTQTHCPQHPSLTLMISRSLFLAQAPVPCRNPSPLKISIQTLKEPRNPIPNCLSLPFATQTFAAGPLLTPHLKIFLKPLQETRRDLLSKMSPATSSTVRENLLLGLRNLPPATLSRPPLDHPSRVAQCRS